MIKNVPYLNTYIEICDPKFDDVRFDDVGFDYGEFGDVEFGDVECGDVLVKSRSLKYFFRTLIQLSSSGSSSKILARTFVIFYYPVLF